ncbi:bolA-like protein 3 isoform X2 [Erinaceus europaeus]|uniref:BolA-like protein 3 isoform X2 n=1 Tax=Erinaceus europaeus TaxID=9365 RepID=A0A1S3W5Q5_ERIEU|nr:bolA-like protein 3 isoform X2 [Erinaceus europaeus]
MAAWSPAAAAPLLRGIRGLPLLHCVQRTFASQTEGELRVTQILKEKFPQATAIKVTDISGTQRRNQRDAWIANFYLRPQTLSTALLHICCCFNPWKSLTDSTVSYGFAKKKYIYIYIYIHI